MQGPITRQTLRPLLLMLLLSGAVHLLLAAPWSMPADIQAALARGNVAHTIVVNMTVPGAVMPTATPESSQPAEQTVPVPPTEKPQPPKPEREPAPRSKPAPSPAPEKTPFPEGPSAGPQEVVVQAESTTPGGLASMPASPVEQQAAWRRSPRPPVYPALARRRDQEGEVLLRLDLDARGQITEARVLVSSGFPLLDQAALSAGRGWQLLPALLNGVAVASYVQVPVQFRLDQSP